VGGEQARGGCPRWHELALLGWTRHVLSCYDFRSNHREGSTTKSEAQTKVPMAVPKPGRPVRGSRTGRPIMALLDLLGRRWALRILWEARHGPLSFRALRERCDGMSPSVLM